MFIKFNWYWLIVFCVILTLVCSSRACHMWLTRNHMFIREIWEKFTSFIVWNFEISLVSLGRFQSFKKVNSVNLSQISHLNMWLLVLSTWLSEICLTSLIALFWNFPLMICNFPLMIYNVQLLFSHSKNIWMSTLITIIITY